MSDTGKDDHTPPEHRPAGEDTDEATKAPARELDKSSTQENESGSLYVIPVVGTNDFTSRDARSEDMSPREMGEAQIPVPGETSPNGPAPDFVEATAPNQGQQESDERGRSSLRNQDLSDLHQTLVNMNLGIQEIASTLRTTPLLHRGPMPQGMGHMPPVSGPPGPPMPRPRSVSTASSASAQGWIRTTSKVEAKVRDCNWAQFMNQYPKDGKKRAIDVLVSGEELADEIKTENIRRSRGERNSLPSFEENSSTRTQQRWITRVRIQSTAINLLLRMVAEVDDIRWDNDTKTFKRPFRLFIRMQDRMKEELSKLKRYLHDQGQLDEENIASATDAVAEDPRDNGHGSRSVSSVGSRALTPSLEDIDIPFLSKLPGAVDQIQCYIEFVESRILPDFERFANIDAKTSHQVRYEDLWYIFRTGELIYKPKRKTVHSQKQDVATAQTIWKLFYSWIPGDRDSDRDGSPEDDKFTIDCYYIDYNGTEFTAINSVFRISRYDGEREVTSLPLYPLRFAPNSAQILEQARSTGQRFIDNISNHSRYGSYSGWTLIHNPLGEPVQDAQLSRGETVRAEHVNSDIIVDTRKCFLIFVAFYFSPNTWRPRLATDVKQKRASTAVQTGCRSLLQTI